MGYRFGQRNDISFLFRRLIPQPLKRTTPFRYIACKYSLLLCALGGGGLECAPLNNIYEPILRQKGMRPKKSLVDYEEEILTDEELKKIHGNIAISDNILLLFFPYSRNQT